MAVNTKDKYYTPEWLVELTIKKAIEIIGKENITEIVEPSAGDGAFIELLKKYFPELKQRYYDLYPEHPEVERYDYKKVKLTYKRGRMTIGNPPFGTSSSLWKAFCKKAATNSDYIVFISPASQYKSNYYFKEGELIYSELLNDVEYRGSEEYGGKDQKVRTCLNIYKVYDREEEEDWRYTQLQKDVEMGPFDDYTKEYDFYMGRMWQSVDKMLTKEEILTHKYLFRTINVKNKALYENVKLLLYNYKEYGEKECKTGLKSGLIEYLIKHLYPTREERLEQDVLIEERGHSSSDVIDDTPYDFYMTRVFSGIANKPKVIEKPTSKQYIGIRVLNRDMYDKVKNALDKYETNVEPNERLTNYLKRHLYPTREERLEQDISIDHSNRIFEYHISQLGDAGRTTKERIAASSYGITILNENLRDKFEQSFDLIKQLIQKHPSLSIASGGSMSINKHAVKEVLMNVLYPQDDPSFEGYDYPEVRKPVHVERAFHCKPLIPVEYREEIIKVPKEETKVAAIALF